MKKYFKKLPSVILLSSVAAISLTCCSLAATLVVNAQQEHDNEIPIPKEMLKIQGDTLYGLADDVTMQSLCTSPYTYLDLSKDTLGVEIKKIAPYAFASVFCHQCTIHGVTFGQELEEIGQGAFYFSPSLQSPLYLPPKLKIIGADAFNYAGFTGGLRIPDSVEKIGAQAFWHVDTFGDTLTIPSSVKEVGFRAFKNLENISDIDMSSYERIPAWMCKSNTIFHEVGGQYSSRQVTIHVSIKENSLDDWKNVFTRQGVGDKVIYEGANVKATDESCFVINGDGIIEKFSDTFIEHMGEYDILRFPSNIKGIKEGAFKDAITAHKLTLEIPSNISAIPKEAFKGCYGLLAHNLSLPETLTSIGESAFEGCRGLTGILNFPDVQSGTWKLSGKHIFKDCTGLTGLKPKATNIIEGDGIFQGCSSISLLDFTDYRDAWRDNWSSTGTCLLDGIASGGRILYDSENLRKSEEEFQQFMDTNAGIHGGVGMATAQEPRPNWQAQLCPIERAVPDMDGYILINKELCHGITRKYLSSITDYNTIQIPDVVTAIDKEAFKGKLQPKQDIDQWMLKMNLGISEIRDSAFEDCTGIVNIFELPTTLEKIGNKAFKNCSNMVGVLQTPKVLTTIGDEAFSKTRICKIILSDKITSIGASAFADSQFMNEVDLTAITDPNSITVGNNAFSFNNSIVGKVYVHTGTTAAWKTKLSGLPTTWSFVEVA